MTHNKLFNERDASIVEDMTIEMLKRELEHGQEFKDCCLAFKFNGKDYDADYWQECTEAGDMIWCCEVTQYDIEMNMRDYDTEFMWSNYVDNI